jgi:hypothetical protein
MSRFAFFIGITIPLSLYFFSNMLENLAYIATIVASGTVIVAYLDYRSRKKKESTFSVVEQLHFYRTKILVTFSLIYSKVQDKDKNFDFKSIDLGEAIEVFDYVPNRIKYKDIFKRQRAFSETFGVRSLVIKLVNQLEEFSWMVILNDTQNESALCAVQNGYTDFIERFTSLILNIRLKDKKKFEGIRRLYGIWSTQVSRESDDEIRARVRQEISSYQAKLEKESSAGQSSKTLPDRGKSKTCVFRHHPLKL